MKLTNAQVKSAKAKDRPYELPDAKGLILYVAPSWLRSWRLRCRWEGKEQLLTLGG